MLVALGVVAINHLLVSYSDVLYSIGLGVAVLCTYLTPFGLGRAVKVLNHVGHILGCLLYIDGKRSGETGCLAEFHEILYSKAVGRVFIPVTGIGLALVGVANHLLEAVFGCVYHGSAVAQEGEALFYHGITNVATIGQPFELLFGGGHQCHLVYFHCSGTVDVYGKACLLVVGIRGQCEGVALPVLRYAFYLLASIFGLAVGAFQHYGCSTVVAQAFHVQTTFEFLSFTQGYSPAVQTGVGYTYRAVTRNKLYGLCIAAVVGVGLVQ